MDLLQPVLKSSIGLGQSIQLSAPLINGRNIRTSTAQTADAYLVDINVAVSKCRYHQFDNSC